MNSMDSRLWQRGGRQAVLRVYLKLHEHKIVGEHWLWAVIVRVTQGEKVESVLRDYGFVPEKGA